MGLAERMEMSLWQLLGGEEVRPHLFTMNNAKKFYYDMIDKYSKAKHCALSVKPKGNRYAIAQVMLDGNLEPIKTSGDACVGRQLIANSIDDELRSFMGGESCKLLEL